MDSSKMRVNVIQNRLENKGFDTERMRYDSGRMGVEISNDQFTSILDLREITGFDSLEIRSVSPRNIYVRV